MENTAAAQSNDSSSQGNTQPSASNPSEIFRRYKWQDLKQSEKEALNDAMGLAVSRAGVGIGTVWTSAALFAYARRGRKALPPVLRYGSFAVFTLAGAYAGFMSGGPTYARRILSVPDSRLADDLRIVIGDWQTRLPAADVDANPHEALPDGPAGSGRGKDEIISRDPKVVRAEQRAAQQRQQ